MSKMVSCAFNMDIACVELKFTDARGERGCRQYVSAVRTGLSDLQCPDSICQSYFERRPKTYFKTVVEYAPID